MAVECHECSRFFDRNKRKPMAFVFQNIKVHCWFTDNRKWVLARVNMVIHTFESKESKKQREDDGKIHIKSDILLCVNLTAGKIKSFLASLDTSVIYLCVCVCVYIIIIFSLFKYSILETKLFFYFIFTFKQLNFSLVLTWVSLDFHLFIYLNF